jgi:hypothetical protein
MEIKGTGIKTTRDFVRSFYPNEYEKWIDSLPEKSRVLYVPLVLNLAGWYNLMDGYNIPMQKIVELFYKNDVKRGGEALGAYSAELALTGIYKLFLMVASPKYLIQRASTMFSTYYIPSSLVVAEINEQSVSMQILKFQDISNILEYRIAGWCIRALELCNCINPRYEITCSLANGDGYTEFVFSWD